MDFCSSETHLNLMRAFAGESQARNRYTFAAETAKEKKIYVLEYVFKFTADQEKAHAKVFIDHLNKNCQEEIKIEAAYPVEKYDDILSLLENAQNNEYKEYDDVYKTFGEIAAKEGYNEIAHSFREIAEIEKIHSGRFECFKQLLKEDKLFKSDVKVGWMCLNCGFRFEGLAAPEVCPVCQHEKGYFIRVELVPYGGKYCMD